MFGLFKKMKGQAEAINDYFTDGAKLYAFLSNEDAGVAALTAAKVAATIQRESMIDYCNGFASDLEEMAPQVSQKLRALASECSQKDWSMSDVVEAKNELAKINPDMLKALNTADGQYFRRTFPDFFRDW